MTTEAQVLQCWLQHQPRNVREMLNRAQRIAEIDHALHEHWAHEAWISSLRIANIRGSTVVLFAQTAAALVPLRYRKKALLEFLKQRFAIACNELDIKVRPDTRVNADQTDTGF
ncbi:MAG: hypothetical protein ACRETW_13890 [Stenotrophobium sp.]